MLEGNYERKIGLEEVWVWWGGLDWFRGFRVYTIWFKESFIKEQNSNILNNPTIQKYNTACNTTFNINITFSVCRRILILRVKKKRFKSVLGISAG